MKRLIYQEYNFESTKSTDTFLTELEEQIPKGLFVHFSKRPVDNGYSFIYQTNWMRMNGIAMSQVDKTKVWIETGPTSSRLAGLTIYLLVFVTMTIIVVSNGRGSELIMFLVALVILVSIGLSMTFYFINRAKRKALQIVYAATKID